MKPYYEHGGITIYHGDCRDVLPGLPNVDLILTDPPYGIGADEAAAEAGMGRIKAAGASKTGRGWRYYGESSWDRSRPEPGIFAVMRWKARDLIIWGGNYFADTLPISQGWLVWDKGQRDFSLADFELAWTSFDNAGRLIQYSRAKAMQDGKEHPTQKSREVIQWCVTAVADRYAKSPPTSILDPFMGSGTTLVVAKDLGRSAIGIEAEERYCEIAARRLSQEVLDLGAA